MQLNSLRSRLWAIILCALIPAALLIPLSIWLKMGPSQAASQGLDGLEYQNRLRTLAEAAIKERAVVAAKGSEADLTRARGDVQNAIESVDELDHRVGAELGVAGAWASWKQERAKDAAGPSAAALDLQMERLLAVGRQIQAASHSLRDPSNRGPLLHAALVDLLAGSNQVARARDAGAAVDPKQAAAVEGAAIHLADSLRSVPATSGGGDLLATVRPFTEAGGSGAADRFAAALRQGKPEEAAGVANAAVASGFAAHDALLPVVRAGLEQSRKDLAGQALWLGGLLVSALALIVAPLLYLLCRPMVKQTDQIAETLQEIGLGNFDARSGVQTRDELGQIAVAINSMMDNFGKLIRSQSERDDIQRAVQKLMTEIADVASGDLTVEAEVSNDFTGSLADAVNFMILQLRAIVTNVHDATIQVSSSANEIQITTEYLSRGGDEQANQIQETSAAIDEIASSIQQVADNASQSLSVAEQARVTARKGTEAVSDTIKGMDRIRDQVQETAKRIKRLGESSQEIGDIIKLISDIADRTSILALNASIQAAMAGEAGRGFAVVAEEVERLSERSNEATRKVASLIKTIQTTTAEAVAAMEESTREVVEGSNLTLTAGSALSEIDSVSNRLAEIIQSIAYSVKQQARGSEALSKSMGQISQVTQQTAAGTREAAQSVSDLARLADELRNSVSTFKLPHSDGRNGVHSHLGGSSGGLQRISSDNIPRISSDGIPRLRFGDAAASQFNQRVAVHS
jgi:methyl-accepting chemotaxis protein